MSFLNSFIQGLFHHDNQQSQQQSTNLQPHPSFFDSFIKTAGNVAHTAENVVSAGVKDLSKVANATADFSNKNVAPNTPVIREVLQNLDPSTPAAARVVNFLKDVGKQEVYDPAARGVADVAATASGQPIKLPGIEVKESVIKQIENSPTLTSKLLTAVGVAGDVGSLVPAVGAGGKVAKAAAEDIAAGAPVLRNATGAIGKDVTGTPQENFTKALAGPEPTPAAPEAPGGAPAENPAVGKLITALQEAKPLQKELAAARSEELSKRVAIGSRTLESTPGAQGFERAYGALKGPLANEQPLVTAGKLNESDLNTLFDQIKTAPNLRFFDQLNAYEGLNKVFKGEVPQKSELALLEHVFGTDLVKEVLKNRSTGEKLRAVVTDAANVPRTLLSSVDFSAPLRQGLVLSARHPVLAAKSAGSMFKQALSEKSFNGWLDNYYNSPEFLTGKDAGLHITDPRKLAGGLGSREEAFMSSFAERIPLVGHLVKGSERAYVGFLNKLRADSFSQLSKNVEDPAHLKSLATFINSATGRGSLGNLEKIAPELNATLFSPRLIASRLSFLNPQFYASLEGPARTEAVQAFGSLLAAGTTVLTLAKLGGAEVQGDPRSSDFGKIKIGDTRFDIWGGFSQYVRVAAQILTGEKVQDGEVKKADRLDTAVNFARGKLAPVPGAAVNVAQGTNVVGDPTTPASVAQDLTVPFNIKDTVAAAKDLGLVGALGAGVAGTFGVGVNSYPPKAPSGSSSTGSGKSGGSGSAKTKTTSQASQASQSSKSVKTSRSRGGAKKASGVGRIKKGGSSKVKKVRTPSSKVRSPKKGKSVKAKVAKLHKTKTKV